MKTFARAIETIDSLSLEEQEDLVRTVQRRIAERRRTQVAADIRVAGREFRSGRVKSASVRAIMAAIQR